MINNHTAGRAQTPLIINRLPSAPAAAELTGTRQACEAKRRGGPRPVACSGVQTSASGAYCKRGPICGVKPTHDPQRSALSAESPGRVRGAAQGLVAADDEGDVALSGVAPRHAALHFHLQLVHPFVPR